MSFSVNFDDVPPTSELCSEICPVEHHEEAGEITMEMENVLNTGDLSKPTEIQLGQRHDLRRYLSDLRLECVAGNIDPTAHDTVKLAIFGPETEEGMIIWLKRESQKVWRNTAPIELSKDTKELGILVTPGEWVHLEHVWFTKDELDLASEKQGAWIEKTFTSEEVLSVLKLSLAITETPQEKFGGEAIDRDELLEIARRLASRGIESYHLFEGEGNQPYIEKSISALRLAVRLTPDDHVSKPAKLSYLGVLLRHRFERTGNPLDISEAISLQQRAVQIAPYVDIGLVVFLSNLGDSFVGRFSHTDALADISEAISYQRQAIRLAPGGYAEMPSQFNNLGISLRHRFGHNGDLMDISEAISLQQWAVQLTCDEDLEKLEWMVQLGISLIYRFQHTGDLSDIAKAISLQKRAVQLTPNGHPEIAERLNNLGAALKSRFNHNGDFRDILGAISLQRKAVQLTAEGDSNLPKRLCDLGVSLMRRFERTGDLSDISEAIVLERQVLELTPHGHPDIPAMKLNLGTSLMNRFRRTGDINDISEAISVQKEAVQLSQNRHAWMPVLLNNLGLSLMLRFERTGDLSDISEAIFSQREAVQNTPDDHTDFPRWLNNLAQSLIRRFERTGGVQDISEAISLQQKAVILVPDGKSNLPSLLNGLGCSFMLRFYRTGELPDVAEAISLQQRAIQLTPHDDIAMASRLTNLGNSFMARFKYSDNLSDISETISCQRKAVQLTPSGHTSMPSQLSNLGEALRCRFKRNDDLDDISEAIALHKRAVELAPIDHAGKFRWLNHLGSSFSCRFSRTNDPLDIADAISTHQQAIQLTPNGHAEMAWLLSSLATAFSRRFERTGDLSDISEAISFQRRAVQLTPDGHAGLTELLNNLAHFCALRIESTGDMHDVQEAASIYQQSTSSFGPPAGRLTAARGWAHFCMIHDLPQALEAFGIAVDLISQVAGMHRTIEQRHTDLIDISTLTTAAASVALSQGEAEKALEWLEQGRCLVWNQINQLRTPVDTLREHDEQLAQRFLDISCALESSGSRGGLASLGVDAPMSHKMSLEVEAYTHIKLAREWYDLLDEIRGVPGFSDFLRPPRAPKLLKNLPHDGPIVLINIHETRCDALALVQGSDMPIHIPLDNFTYKQALDLKERLRNFLFSKRIRMPDVHRAGRPVKRHKAEQQSELHLVLKELWVCVVRPILDGLAFSDDAPSELRRIWWCPTGPLAFLPLHAAGIYDEYEKPPPGSCISALSVSSYTPTVSALLEKLKRSSDTQSSEISPNSLLVISQPKTPGCAPLPGTMEEMRLISKTIEEGNIQFLSLEGEAATVNRVKLEMESHRSIHFACHANQNTENPLKSCFYLHDGPLELMEIIKQKIAYCDLAFLSACQTSTGNEKLSEEAVHLAAGMLAVGYRSVVATMWSINDYYGPKVAENFYKYLLDQGKTVPGKPRLDCASGAYALHHAIQSIRERVGDTEQGLLMWVPYVHFGF